MKKYIFVPESLLLLWVAGFNIFRNMIWSNTAADIHLHDTYISATFYPGAVWMRLFIVFTYMVHIALRRAGKRYAVISNVHIWATILITGLLEAVTPLLWQGKMLLWIFVIVQLLFSGYGLYRLSGHGREEKV